jgi:hypothetical protein
MVKRVKAPGQQTPRSPRKRAPQREKAAPADDVIRERAYELFERRGGEPGHELEDWLTAERELRPDE